MSPSTFEGKLRQAILNVNANEIKRIFKTCGREPGQIINFFPVGPPSTLDLSLYRFNYRIFKLLLENGANINILNPVTLQSSLIREVIFGVWQKVYTLVNHGADIYIHDKDGHNALYYARLNKNKKIIKLLEDVHIKNKKRLHRTLYSKTKKLDNRCIEKITEYICYL